MKKVKCNSCENIIEIDVSELEEQKGNEFAKCAISMIGKISACGACQEKKRLEIEIHNRKMRELEEDALRQLEVDKFRERQRTINAKCRLPQRFRHDYDHELGNSELLKFVETNKDGGIFLQSVVSGVGKTRAVVYVAGKLIDSHAVDVRYYKTSELVRKLAGLYTSDITAADKLIDDLCKCDLFILEEFGKEKMTDRVGEWIFEILDRRYENGKPFWITSNKGGKGLKEHHKERGEYIVRRIRDMCAQWVG